MLDKKQVEKVILSHVFDPTTPTMADQIANELGLPSGSVQFGEKAINIQDGDKIHHVQIKLEGNAVDFIEA
jgi:hypothetical protein